MRLFLYSVLAAAVYLLLLFPRWKKQRGRFLLLTVFYAYVCAVVYLTLLPISATFDPNTFDGDYGNFIPFRDLKMGYGGALKDIILNVIMTVPFGFLYPLIRKSGLIKTTVFGIFLSAVIESLQLASRILGSTYHIFDITDIISNTIGVFIGCLCCLILRRIIKR